MDPDSDGVHHLDLTTNQTTQINEVNKMNQNLSVKLETLKALIEKEYGERLKIEYPHTQFNGVRLKEGKKYVNVDVGESGKYMVVKDTEEIFGIKAYGVIHRGHSYGTLDTIGNYNWSGYSAQPKQEEIR